MEAGNPSSAVMNDSPAGTTTANATGTEAAVTLSDHRALEATVSSIAANLTETTDRLELQQQENNDQIRDDFNEVNGSIKQLGDKMDMLIGSAQTPKPSPTPSSRTDVLAALQPAQRHQSLSAYGHKWFHTPPVVKYWENVNLVDDQAFMLKLAEAMSRPSNETAVATATASRLGSGKRTDRDGDVSMTDAKRRQNYSRSYPQVRDTFIHFPLGGTVVNTDVPDMVKDIMTSVEGTPSRLPPDHLLIDKKDGRRPGDVCWVKGCGYRRHNWRACPKLINYLQHYPDMSPSIDAREVRPNQRAHHRYDHRQQQRR